MRKSFLFLLLFFNLGFILLGLVYVGFWRDSPAYANYKKVRVGMSVEEVQAILGRGKVTKQENVRQIIVAVNPQDEIDALEKQRRSGGPPLTRYTYPTRSKHVVEGDVILMWEDSGTGEEIFVAFKNGKVCEKDYYDSNYL